MHFLRVFIPTLYPCLLHVERLEHIGYLFLMIFATPKPDFAKVCVSLTVGEIHMGLMLCCLWGGQYHPAPTLLSSRACTLLRGILCACLGVPRCIIACRYSSAPPDCAGIINILFFAEYLPVTTLCTSITVMHKDKPPSQ